MYDTLGGRALLFDTLYVEELLLLVTHPDVQGAENRLVLFTIMMHHARRLCFLCNAASADGKAGGVQIDSDTGEGAGKAEGQQEDQDKVEEKEVEEEEGSGETVFLPTGDNKDFRLFRAKLRAGSDEKWREQLKRNVNVGQLSGQDAWAHELSAPEKGCLIVAKAQDFSMAQTYFNEVSPVLEFRGYLSF